MDQPEEILEKLERFNVQKNPEITRELDEYVSFVARTGESVFNWALVKRLYREKLINVITEFYNETPTKELPQYPNVDPFNYETMKKMLIERLDSFNAAPFTIQRISELLSDPRKQYSRIDKFMRAVEKNILVVSTVSPGRNRSEESENGDSLDSVGLNGDFSSDVNVDIDMENDGSFAMTKEFNATTHRKEANHDVVTETHETVTIKKIASKEEEAGTSAIAMTANGEELQPTQTDIKIETQTVVTITPLEEDKPATQESAEKGDEIVEETQKTEEETVIKSDIQHEPITLLTENVEPKIDDALLNEPLRPVDDEILPENPETTPLAALENIVANRVEVVISEPPRIEEAVPQKQDIEEPKVEEQEMTPKEQPIEQKSEEIPTSEHDNSTDDSGIEAKRIKIEEVPEIVAETTDAPVVDTQAETLPEIAAQPIVTEESAPEPVVEEPPEEQPLETQSSVEEPEAQVEVAATQENAEAVISDTPIIEPIVEVTKEVEALPVVEEPIVQSPQPEIPITEPAVEEPIPAETPLEIEPVVENTMALDEDLTTAQIPQIPQEMPQMEVAPNNKMDTDENETENVLMDTDETEEPMDQ